MYIVHRAEKEVEKTEQLYMDGVITNGERHNKVVSIWYQATADVAGDMAKNWKARIELPF